MQLKHIETDNHPRIGARVYTAPEDWKISCLWEEAHGNWMAGIYDNKSRRDSQVIWNGKSVFACNAETIGQPIEWRGYVAAAGECGKLIYSRDGHVGEGIPLKWASACAVWGDVPVVINWDGETQQVLDCLTGHQIATMPGTGIAMAAIDVGGLLVAAIADSDDQQHGLACSDGRLLKAPACQCVVMFCKKLLYSTRNRIGWFDGTKDLCLGELPCEKIMDMRVLHGSSPYGFLRVAGSNPDTVWDIDNMARVVTVGTFSDGNREVGGSCFRVRASEHYVARAINGTQGVIHAIEYT